jgi:hypothetical protein
MNRDMWNVSVAALRVAAIFACRGVSINSLITLSPILTNLDLSFIGAYYSPSISNTKLKDICKRRQ